MYIKGAYGEVSEWNEEHVTGNWKKGKPCYTVAKNLAELHSTIGEKADLINNKFGYVAEDISKQSVEDAERGCCL